PPPPLPPFQDVPQQQNIETVPLQQQAPALEQVRSLHDAFTDRQPSRQSYQQQMTSFQPLRKVVFEMPPPFGKFHVQYHDVIRQDMVLVLVYDHSRPLQMAWFPQAIEDPNSGQPAPLAALVAGDSNEQDMLYLVHPTGLSFTFENKEFNVLTIEKEK